MKKAEFRKLRKRLEAKETEILKAVGNHDSIAVDSDGDELDKLRGAIDRDLAMSNLSRESYLLKEVRAALKRIADGSYGNCESCGSPIPVLRLEAVPWASFCLACQRRFERADRYAA